MNIEGILAGRMNLPDVKAVAEWAQASRENLESLWTLSLLEETRIPANALWVLTHLKKEEKGWLKARQEQLIDRLLCESDTSKKRMLLQLLRNQEFYPESVRPDLIDYCLGKINSENEPYAIRCFSIYVAFKCCRFYPELISELEGHLEMLSLQPLSPGLKCALRQTKAAIAGLRDSKLRKSNLTNNDYDY